MTLPGSPLAAGLEHENDFRLVTGPFQLAAAARRSRAAIITNMSTWE
jgi:hypothetical protein